MFDVNSFCEKKIMVTGAGSGIGRATAIRLSNLGAIVILIGRDEQKLNITLSKMTPGKHQIISYDLLEFEGYETLFLKSTEKSKLDGLVHCAGIAKAIPIKVISEKAIDEIMNINYKSFVLLTKFFSKKKYSNDNASIVACSAVNAHYPQKCMGVYEASKLAVEGVVRGFADELYANRKIRINAMVIGPIVTPMAGYSEDDTAIVGQKTEITPNIMGFASSNDVASMAVFLLSTYSSYSTGRNFYVDGGRL